MAKFSKKQTGTPSSFGGAKTKGGTINPWGKNKPKQLKPTTNKVTRGSNRKSTPDPQLRAVPNYVANDPRSWPKVKPNGLPEKNPSPTAPSPATATRQNAIVNNAFKRGGYAG
jgi:hypothetical protein